MTSRRGDPGGSPWLTGGRQPVSGAVSHLDPRPGRCSSRRTDRTTNLTLSHPCPSSLKHARAGQRRFEVLSSSRNPRFLGCLERRVPSRSRLRHLAGARTSRRRYHRHQPPRRTRGFACGSRFAPSRRYLHSPRAESILTVGARGTRLLAASNRQPCRAPSSCPPIGLVVVRSTRPPSPRLAAPPPVGRPSPPTGDADRAPLPSHSRPALPPARPLRTRRLRSDGWLPVKQASAPGGRPCRAEPPDETARARRADGSRHRSVTHAHCRTYVLTVNGHAGPHT